MLMGSSGSETGVIPQWWFLRIRNSEFRQHFEQAGRLKMGFHFFFSLNAFKNDSEGFCSMIS